MTAFASGDQIAAEKSCPGAESFKPSSLSLDWIVN
jgi:hypothetical protein